MRRICYALTVAIAALMILGSCDPKLTGPAEEATRVPRPSPTVSNEPMPAPHVEGEPHGLGVTTDMVVEALGPKGFDFVHDFSPAMRMPLTRGYAQLGPRFTIWSVGHPQGVVEFTLETNWPKDAEPPIETILFVTDLVTPRWDGAEQWVSDMVDQVQGQEDAERSIATGNYHVRVSAFTVGDSPGVNISFSPRFASCEDALAARDWTTESRVGRERGYAGWRVPSAPDPDGDGTVCENIQ